MGPPNGANVGANIHPTFSWLLPGNERSEAVYVATSGAATPARKFFQENVEQTGSVPGTATQWTPDSPLPAGTYWWNVQTTDQSTFASDYSPPISFSITPLIHKLLIEVERYRNIRELGVGVTFRANVERATVTVSAYRGETLVRRKREVAKGLSVGKRNTKTVFLRLRGRRARHVRVVATVQSGTAKVRKKLIVRGV